MKYYREVLSGKTEEITSVRVVQNTETDEVILVTKTNNRIEEVHISMVKKTEQIKVTDAVTLPVEPVKPIKTPVVEMTKKEIETTEVKEIAEFIKTSKVLETTEEVTVVKVEKKERTFSKTYEVTVVNKAGKKTVVVVDKPDDEEPEILVVRPEEEKPEEQKPEEEEPEKGTTKVVVNEKTGVETTTTTKESVIKEIKSVQETVKKF